MMLNKKGVKMAKQEDIERVKEYSNLISEGRRDLADEMRDFTGADLSGANLSKLNLTDAKFYNANFEGAKLRHVMLIDADLRRANFKNAIIKFSDFDLACLSCADLRNVSLYKTSFQEIVCKGHEFEKVDMYTCELSSHSALDEDEE